MDTTETQSKSKKPLIIGIICIVVAIAVVGCFVLFMLNEKTKRIMHLYLLHLRLRLLITIRKLDQVFPCVLKGSILMAIKFRK